LTIATQLASQRIFASILHRYQNIINPHQRLLISEKLCGASSLMRLHGKPVMPAKAPRGAGAGMTLK
jgi:hypothetical protein